MLKVIYKKDQYEDVCSVQLEIDFENYDRSFEGKDVFIFSTYKGLPVTSFESSDNVNLGNVSLPDSIKSLKSGCLAGSKIKKLVIPENVEEIDFLAFSSNTVIENLSISPLNKHFKLIDGNIYSYDGKKLVTYFSRENQKEFIVPSFVEEIGIGAFNRSPSLEKVTFDGNNLKKVDAYAFAACPKLTCVKLPKGLEYVSYNVFESCKKLKEVYFPDTIKYIDKQCFSKTPNAIIYCEFKEPNNKWPKTWKNKEENVVYGFDISNENSNINVVKRKLISLKTKIDQILKLGNIKKQCLEKYDLWETCLSKIKNLQLSKDIKNTISYLIIYFEKNYKDDISMSFLDEILVKHNNIDIEELENIKKYYDLIDDFNINDVKPFIDYLSKLDYNLYELTIDLIVNLSLSKGCLTKNLFNCISLITGITDKYSDAWSRVDINNDDFVSLVKDELVDTGVEVKFEKKDAKNYDVSFNEGRYIHTIHLTVLDEIPILVKLWLKILNLDFKGAADIFEDKDSLKEIKKFSIDNKNSFMSIIITICSVTFFPTIAERNFTFDTNVDDFIRLYDHLEKNGFNMNVKRPKVNDINLFTLVTITFSYAEERKDYEWLKKLFRHMLHNSSIDKTTGHLFLGDPLQILKNVVPNSKCPDRVSFIAELKEVLKKENLYEDDDDDDFVEEEDEDDDDDDFVEEEDEDDDDTGYIKASSPFGSILINPKTGSTKSVTDRVVDVSYKNNSFGLIIAELDSFVKNKSKSFEVTVKYKFKGSPKGTTFDISQAKYSFDNCRYIGTSWQHTFTIMFRGQATLFGYTGDIMMELALKLDEDYFLEIEDIVLNKADYKYDGNHLTVVYKFDIITD